MRVIADGDICREAWYVLVCGGAKTAAFPLLDEAHVNNMAHRAPTVEEA